MTETAIVPETAGVDAASAAVIPQGKAAHEVAYFADFDFDNSTALRRLVEGRGTFWSPEVASSSKNGRVYFLNQKNINILDLEQTVTKLSAASSFLADVVKSGKPVLFVGIKKQTHDTVRSLAERIGMPYVIDRSAGGTLTITHIKGRAKYLYETEEKMARGEFKKYTKFEQAKKSEEVERLEKRMGR